MRRKRRPVQFRPCTGSEKRQWVSSPCHCGCTLKLCGVLVALGAQCWLRLDMSACDDWKKAICCTCTACQQSTVGVYCCLLRPVVVGRKRNAPGDSLEDVPIDPYSGLPLRVKRIRPSECPVFHIGAVLRFKNSSFCGSYSPYGEGKKVSVGHSKCL